MPYPRPKPEAGSRAISQCDRGRRGVQPAAGAWGGGTTARGRAWGHGGKRSVSPFPEALAASARVVVSWC